MRNGWRVTGIHEFTPFFEMVGSDAGGGAGSGGAVPSPGAAGAAAGADGSAGAGAAGAAGSNGARTISDNDMVLIDGKPVRWADARMSHYMPRDQYDRGAQFLMTMAKQLDANQRGAGNGNAGGQRQGQQPGQMQPGQMGQRPPDPFGDIENMPVVDGRTLAKIGRQMMQEGLGPLGQVITTLATRMQALEQNQRGVGQTVGSLAENHSNNEFEGFITNSLKTMPEVPGLGMVPTDNALVRELAKDLFLSHDQKDPTLMKEFPRMLQERVGEMFKLFTGLQKTFVQKSKEQRRSFFNPAQGAARPTGAPKFQYKNGADLAREFFQATGDANT